MTFHFLCISKIQHLKNNICSTNKKYILRFYPHSSVNRWWRRPCREHYKTRQQRCTVPGSQREPAWQPWLLCNHLDTARLPSLPPLSFTSFVCLFCHSQLPWSRSSAPNPTPANTPMKSKVNAFIICVNVFFFLKSQPCIHQVTNAAVSIQQREICLNLFIF